MKKEYCVYMHTAPNGKKYVGITCCHPRNRRWQNGYGYSDQQIFYNAIRKYGWNNFKHTILEDNLTAEEAGEAEQKYIALYQTTDRNYGYNFMVGGEVGYHLTEEHKKKISDANSGSKNGMYGHHYTDEERKKMSETSVWRGRKHTEESRRKMSEYMKAHPIIHHGAEHPMAKAVLQYDKDGNFVCRYSTAVEASEKTGTPRSGICSCAQGKAKSSNGFIWKYQTGEIERYLPPIEPHRYNRKSAEARKQKVNQYTTDGVYIKTFESVTEANRAMGKKTDNGAISSVARGERKTAHGYIWKYGEQN